VAAAQQGRVEVCLVKDVERVQALQARVVVTNQAVHLGEGGGADNKGDRCTTTGGCGCVSRCNECMNTENVADGMCVCDWV